MKKQLFVARPVKRYSAALLTSLILIVGIFDAKATDKVEKANNTTISYVGLQNSILTFNVNYLNETEDRVVLELSDERGDVLYRRVYKDKEVNKNIYLKNSGDKWRLTFTIRSAKETITQKFDIEPQVSVVLENVVTPM
ncbi:MAG: hypothetical protein LH478_07940 [Chitinophagaceae bacterium]|nr:hypothetical protein [Chitinophagaceae bacterium]